MSSTKRFKYFLLADCNNFYVSCERIFNPKLLNKPVVVLSNNDGCVISRSQEAKDLKIPMGAPYHQYEEFFQKHGVAVCSSNYALYGDLSQRVMDLLRMWSSEVQVYSIDEAFVLLDGKEASLEYLKAIRKQVEQWVGIPLSLGLGPTKTLAKIANHFAKKQKLGCYLMPTKSEAEPVLKKLPVEEVWGIGRQLSLFLKSQNIHTAWELACADDAWIKKHLTVVGLRTAWELRGISCLELEEVVEPRKGIMSSRSFGTYTQDYAQVAEALSSYTVRAVDRLRKQRSLASTITVFLSTNRHNLRQEYYTNEAYVTLPESSNYTPLFIHYAKQCLEKIFRPECTYKKVGICLGGIVSEGVFQADLFDQVNPEDRAKQQRILALMDQVKVRWGKKALHFAAEGIEQPWKMKQSKLSNSFTTRWKEILQVKI